MEEKPEHPLSRGASRITAERVRQVIGEGWTIEHDDEHTDGSLRVVAATLAVEGTDAIVVDPDERGSDQDPWGLISKHAGDEIRRLEIAGALIAAEIDRLLRQKDSIG